MSASVAAQAGTVRRAAIARAALRVLAAGGARGLTHRAVDAEAGLPAGSVNYYAPTRAGLLELAAQELYELDTVTALERLAPLAELPTDRPLPAITSALADLVESLTAPDRAYLVLARHELLGESARSQPLRTVFARQRAAFVDLTRRFAEGVGCRTPDEHADLLVVVVDGLVLRQVLTGPGRLTREQLAADLTRVLRTC